MLRRRGITPETLTRRSRFACLSRKGRGDFTFVSVCIAAASGAITSGRTPQAACLMPLKRDVNNRPLARRLLRYSASSSIDLRNFTGLSARLRI
jgi:hypothetical protein